MYFKLFEFSSCNIWLEFEDNLSSVRSLILPSILKIWIQILNKKKPNPPPPPCLPHSPASPPQSAAVSTSEAAADHRKQVKFDSWATSYSPFSYWPLRVAQRTMAGGSGGVCMMNVSWKEQHPSFVHFISSFLSANSYRLNFLPIAPVSVLRFIFIPKFMI